MNSKQADSELRMVLFGRTGVGKSSLGNAILGRRAFEAKWSSASVTNKCQKETREFEGKTLSVVDTPGLFHTTKEKPQLMKEIFSFVSETRPGPHVLLLVLKNGAKGDNKNVLKIFQEVFKETKAYTIVLFTDGEKYVVNDKEIRELIDQCADYYYVFDNEEKNLSQVNGLLEKIKAVVEKNGGGYYTDEMFKNADKALEEAMKHVEKCNTAVKPKTQNAEDMIMNYIDQGREKLEQQTPWLKTFFESLEKWAFKLMPSPSY